MELTEKGRNFIRVFEWIGWITIVVLGILIVINSGCKEKPRQAMIMQWTPQPDTLGVNELARLGAWLIETNTLSQGKILEALIDPLVDVQIKYPQDYYQGIETRLSVSARITTRAALQKAKKQGSK
jgi:hypothetical protein